MSIQIVWNSIQFMTKICIRLNLIPLKCCKDFIYAAFIGLNVVSNNHASCFSIFSGKPVYISSLCETVDSHTLIAELASSSFFKTACVVPDIENDSLNSLVHASSSFSHQIRLCYYKYTCAVISSLHQ